MPGVLDYISMLQSLPPPLACILFTLFLANTCVLIPATSTPSAGGHRQLPLPFLLLNLHLFITLFLNLFLSQ